MVRFSARYLAKRLGYSYLTVVAIITLVFLFAQTRPGTIVTVMSTTDMGPTEIAELEREWAAGEPLWRQYLEFQWNYQTGTLGRSQEFTAPISAVIIRRTGPTLLLFGSALIFAFGFGPIVGAYLGWYRGSKLDRTLFTSGIVSYSVPAFWVGFLLIWGFWAHWDVFPRRFMFSQFPGFEWTVFTTIRNALKHAFLPVFTLCLTTWFGVMIVMRTMMVNESTEEYVRLAEAKGLSDRAVMFKHAARNALIPVVTQGIVIVSLLIGGSVILERVFAWRGLGDLLVVSVEELDIPVTLATFYVLGLFVVVVRLLADIAYTSLDPRVSFGSEEVTNEAPPIHYPGGWKAVWGALGHIAIYASMIPVALSQRATLIENATVRPFSGNLPAVTQIPDSDRGPVLITKFVDPSVFTDFKLAGIVTHNAHFSPLTIPAEVFQETAVSNPSPDDLSLGAGIRSLSVNLLRSADSPELLVLFLVPPVVYLCTGILATRNGEYVKPFDRGLAAASQFTGCLPLVVVSLFLLGFSMRAGLAGPNPLFSLVFVGVLYPAIFGLLGGYIAARASVTETLFAPVSNRRETE